MIEFTRRLKTMNFHRAHVLHVMFWIGIAGKTIDGLLETLGGAALWMVDRQFVSDLVHGVFRHELFEHPNDLIANYVSGLVGGMSPGTQGFASLYLLVHGLIKLGLVAGIWSNRLWAYPLAGIVLSLLVVYQSVRLALSPSAILFVLTLVDVAIIALIWPEYKRLST